MALVEACMDPSVVFDDVIAGREGGLIFSCSTALDRFFYVDCANMRKWPARTGKDLDSRGSS